MMKSFIPVALVVAFAFAATGPAAAVSNKKALKDCKARYGKSVTHIKRKKNGQILCIRSTGFNRARFEALSHNDKLDWCRKHFKGEGTIYLTRKRGKTFCTYVW